MPNMTQLFDALREEHEIKSDAALARRLDLTPPEISKARKSGVLSDRMIVRISERLSVSIAAIRELAT